MNFIELHQFGLTVLVNLDLVKEITKDTIGRARIYFVTDNKETFPIDESYEEVKRIIDEMRILCT